MPLLIFGLLLIIFLLGIGVYALWHSLRLRYYGCQAIGLICRIDTLSTGRGKRLLVTFKISESRTIAFNQDVGINSLVHLGTNHRLGS